jgi:hypothetical protein
MQCKKKMKMYITQKLLFFYRQFHVQPINPRSQNLSILSSQAKNMSSSKKIDLGPDEQELLRVTTQHKILKAGYSHKLVQAPINLSQPGLRILDSACADGKSTTTLCPRNSSNENNIPGLWLKDIQQSLNPSHELFGTDINPNFFPRSPPRNTTFQVQDVTKPWPTEWKSSFDLVHSRLGLAGCGDFPVEQAVKNMIHLVKPGGWIQLDEMEVNKVTEGDGTVGEFGRLLKGMFEASGVQWDFAGSLKGWLHEEGMTGVEERIIDVAYGKNCEDEEIARMSVESMVTGVKAVAFGAKSKLFFPVAIYGLTESELGVMSISDDDTDSLPERMAKELEENGSHVAMITVWGRKPL